MGTGSHVDVIPCVLSPRKSGISDLPGVVNVV